MPYCEICRSIKNSTFFVLHPPEENEKTHVMCVDCCKDIIPPDVDSFPCPFDHGENEFVCTVGENTSMHEIKTIKQLGRGCGRIITTKSGSIFSYRFCKNPPGYSDDGMRRPYCFGHGGVDMQMGVDVDDGVVEEVDDDGGPSLAVPAPAPAPAVPAPIPASAAAAGATTAREAQLLAEANIEIARVKAEADARVAAAQVAATAAASATTPREAQLIADAQAAIARVKAEADARVAAAQVAAAAAADGRVQAEVARIQAGLQQMHIGASNPGSTGPSNAGPMDDDNDAANA
jgi:hypothetical protein